VGRGLVDSTGLRRWVVRQARKCDVAGNAQAANILDGKWSARRRSSGMLTRQKVRETTSLVCATQSRIVGGKDDVSLAPNFDRTATLVVGAS